MLRAPVDVHCDARDGETDVGGAFKRNRYSCAGVFVEYDERGLLYLQYCLLLCLPEDSSAIEGYEH